MDIPNLLSRELLSSSSSPSAAPKRKRPFSSLSLCETDLSSSNDDDAAQETSFLPSSALAHLFHALSNEVIHKRTNVRSILVFVDRVLSLRGYSDVQGDALDNKEKNNSELENSLLNISTEKIKSDKMSRNESWALCFAFIMAYDSLFPRISTEKNPFKFSNVLETDGLACTSDVALSKTSYVNEATRQVSLGIITKIRSFPAVLSCFNSHLGRVDEIFGSFNKKETRNDLKIASKDVFASSSLRKGNVELPPWEELDGTSNLFSYAGSEATSIPEKNVNKAMLQNDQQQQESGKPFESNLAPASETENESNDNVNTSETPDEAQETSSSGLSSYLEKASIDLHEALLLLPREATSYDLQEMADQAVQLLKQGGTELGASGLEKVGFLIAFGSLDVSLANEKMALTDALLSIIHTSVVDEGTSALRTSAFIRSCVLPVCQSLAKDPVSRSLIATVMTLVKDRPVECIDALLLPLLCPTGSRDMRDAVPQSQYELVTRVVKGSLSKDDLSYFLIGLCNTRNLQWTEQSLPIISLCFNKNVVLPDETISKVCFAIERLSCDAEMCKNVKFSALLNSFVMKYGAQIKDHVEVLLKAADRLKSFMSKPILNALKKLK